MNEYYKPNSHKAKEKQKNADEQKKIEPVVTGKVIKKKNHVRKFTDAFVSEDAQNIKSYVLLDVLVPAIKKAVSDIVTNGIDMILYGETGRTKKRGNADYVSYNLYSDRRDDNRNTYNRARNGFSYDDIGIETRGEAEAVLTSMDEIIDTYGVVSVADLYDLVGVTDNNYMNVKYGWKNISSAEPIRVGGGYILRLPKALPIN